MSTGGHRRLRSRRHSRSCSYLSGSLPPPSPSPQSLRSPFFSRQRPQATCGQRPHISFRSACSAHAVRYHVRALCSTNFCYTWLVGMRVVCRARRHFPWVHYTPPIGNGIWLLCKSDCCDEQGPDQRSDQGGRFAISAHLEGIRANLARVGAKSRESDGNAQTCGHHDPSRCECGLWEPRIVAIRRYGGSRRRFAVRTTF